MDKGLKTPIFNREGEAVKSILLPKEIFGQKTNKALLAQVIRIYLANQRPPTASTKTRSEVAGGGRKPHRQKGTGRARAGSIRAPGRRGGGIVFGPQPTATLLKAPKKMRQKAFSIALSDKYTEGNILFVDSLEFKQPKTKTAAKILTKLPLKKRGKILLVLYGDSSTSSKSFRNLENIKIKKIDDLNILDLLKADSSIFTLDALEKLKERFNYGNKQSD
ncbi:MAG: 50S ribosomal protein L4 [Candidatus Woykebacteria bacterium RBG_13_40_15]|uniref:Large ribosomal subunit protein uL4 n=1 Tax=Candidatus Woykebacteria bacterium RBG_13_40_15 TaxID=1802593 RepID=A0A1G1W9B8_9BACT|nr:MAG: 50S ribosomal protein L4 [Candidatus Woykebacteria bacterium RBG_13_40_15]